MIGKLRGLVDTIGDDFIILDVQGVGYLVHCSARTLGELRHTGAEASLAIETQVREDAIRLYGFASEAERDWFRLLQTVQGVGTKVALGLLGTLSVADLAAAIVRQDKGRIAQAPGIGPKLAARLVSELKDKAPAGATLANASSADGRSDPFDPAAVQDAISGLATLGFSRPQAAAAAAEAMESLGASADTAAVIRYALKLLAR